MQTQQRGGPLPLKAGPLFPPCCFLHRHSHEWSSLTIQGSKISTGSQQQLQSRSCSCGSSQPLAAPGDRRAQQVPAVPGCGSQPAGGRCAHTARLCAAASLCFLCLCNFSLHIFSWRSLWVAHSEGSQHTACVDRRPAWDPAVESGRLGKWLSPDHSQLRAWGHLGPLLGREATSRTPAQPDADHPLGTTCVPRSLPRREARDLRGKMSAPSP